MVMAGPPIDASDPKILKQSVDNMFSKELELEVPIKAAYKVEK